eukprot:4181357-Pleurochrysis_carterae.AAC.1
MPLEDEAEVLGKDEAEMPLKETMVRARGAQGGSRAARTGGGAFRCPAPAPISCALRLDRRTASIKSYSRLPACISDKRRGAAHS